MASTSERRKNAGGRKRSAGAYNSTNSDDLKIIKGLADILGEPSELPRTTVVDTDDTVAHDRATVELHAAIAHHWTHWKTSASIMGSCFDRCVETHDVEYAHMLRQCRDKCRHALSNYARWRVGDGCYRCSPSLTKCCGGTAHGWDAICRVFLLESMMFDLIGPERRLRLWRLAAFTKEDLIILTDRRVSVLMSTRIPLWKWSSHMVIMQVRSISQRLNHIEGMAKDGRMRAALSKLVRQCEMRAYALVNASCNYPDLHQKSTHQGEGLLSGKFVGKIVCTPQNNCGMSTVSSFGTWTDRFVWSFSRCSTKVSNILLWADKLIPADAVDTSSMCTKEALGVDFKARVQRFRESALERTVALLDADQLQEQVVASLYPSIVGVDSAVRKMELIQDPRRNSDVWASALAIAPSGLSKWMVSYVRIKRRDFYIESHHAKAMPDIKQLAFLHAFEISTKRDGRNSAGFLSSFILRTEEIQAHSSTLREMSSLSVPVICKIGADYIVSIAGKQVAIFCEDACEALVTWSMIMESMFDWKIQGIDFSSIYAPLFRTWCKDGEQ